MIDRLCGAPPGFLCAAALYYSDPRLIVERDPPPMRFDTFRMSAFLIGELQKARPWLEITDDGCDIIHVRMASGERVYLYLIESPITVDHIRNIVSTNTNDGVYSLFILWSDLFLPAHGTRYIPDDWMAVFMALCGDKIFAFDPYAEGAYIFPVYFEGGGVERAIRHGDAIDAARLHCQTIHSRTPHLRGDWLMADFEQAALVVRADRLKPLFDLLHLTPHSLETLTREHLRDAYRQRAREVHPDLNPETDTTANMQQVNDAYERLLREIE